MEKRNILWQAGKESYIIKISMLYKNAEKNKTRKVPKGLHKNHGFI